MLNYNSPINDTKEYNKLKISEIESTFKLNLRGKKREFISNIGQVLSIMPPVEANTSSLNEDLNLLWLSPDEWLLYSNDIIKSNDYDKLESELVNSISKLNYGSVTNVTDHWVMINLKGDNVYELLAGSCPFNFTSFKSNKRSVVQTIVNHIDVIIHNKNNNDLNLFVRRSFSNHLWSWLNDSSRFI
ncbi:MAG TPA: sarcosine oxidase subunit gamma family protein [Candidatus Pelagibacter bacterium]|jgi:sarcosine oxidase subunit gamma|nr:sarcosine oxidase subunit gamma family protein [Candidatus Pelagibacter bacterium]|tara:strand:- start:127 stop:687 length:561 start_codon:yes stop_codon:yes gene_type:complete